jgi:Na+/melibiose symporter-like transporter
MALATIGIALKVGLVIGSASFLWRMTAFFHFDTRLSNAVDAVAGYRTMSDLVVGILFTICAGLLVVYQLNKKLAIQMADELAERRRQATGIASNLWAAARTGRTPGG